MAQIISGDQVTLINENWVIIPAASPTGRPSPTSWLVVFSGIAVADFTFEEETEYTILIQPDWVGAVNTAVNSYGAPASANNIPRLNIEQLAPSAAVGSVFDPSIPIDRDNSGGLAGALGGFDVRAWVPNAIPNSLPTTDVLTGLSFNQIFTGMLVGITSRDGDGSFPITFRLPYSFTFLAQIVWAFFT